MNKDRLFAKLNWFYSLELNQVDMYTAQATAVNDPYLSKGLTRVASIEQQHVDNIAAEIRRLGGEPTRLGDVVAPILGKTLGTLTGALGSSIMLRTDISLEKKAMSDYQDMILAVGNDPRLSAVLWDNLIDEDLHMSWLANRLGNLGDKGQPAKTGGSGDGRPS